MDVIVSVVIPAYNCAKYIDAALDSVLKQEVPLEVIVIDDASSDGLCSLLSAYDDPRLVYIRNEKRAGVSESRNTGIMNARGNYIAFLDADDIWADGKLIRQLALIREKDVVICSTARELVDLEGNSLKHFIPARTEYTYNDILYHNDINCSSVLIKTEVAREFPMYGDDCHEDYIMWLRVLGKYKKGCAINEPLLKYRVRRNGKTGRKLKSAIMTFKSYRRMGFGIVKSLLFFSSYAYHGVNKYYFRRFLSCKSE